MSKPVIMGNAKLYQGDCRDIIPMLDKVDAVVADPPYGIGMDYGTFLDSPANVSDLAISSFNLMREIAPVIALTPGLVNIHKWPEPTWILAWVPDNSPTGRNPWGFSCWQPILVYGKDPYQVRAMGCRPDVIRTAPSGNELREIKALAHPCPKPIGFLKKLVPRISPSQGETILDPFMGSGTAGVACVDLGRSFIGIEIQSEYFDLACKRIEQAQKQQRLFA